MSVDDFERVRGETDPLAQARLATQLISTYQQRSVELARLRRQAIERIAEETGMTFTAVGAQLGLSKGRISQIRQSAPPAHRGLFGTGPVTVAAPLRTIPGRPMGAVAAEDSRSVDELVAYLSGLQFQVQTFQIPADGQWEPSGDTIAICGPKSSKVTATALEGDPYLSLSPDPSGRWVITDLDTHEVFASPMDAASATNSADLAYVGRLPYEGQTVLIVAGIHALGSLGAVDYLISHAATIYEVVQTNRFSFVVSTEFDGLTSRDHRLLTPIRIHE